MKGPPQRAHAYIEGIALWAPRLPGWEAARAILRGEHAAPDTPAPRPTPSILPAAERRRAPDAVAIALEVAARACEHAGRNPAELASVFASTEGDLSISDYMAATLAATPLQISPTRFHNSVHNAPAGYWTIATSCMHAYTALSAHRYTFANGLLEALVQSASSGESVLFVAYDIEARGPLAAMAKSRGLLAAAIIVSPKPGTNDAIELLWNLREHLPPSAAFKPSSAALIAGNALESCLPLFETLADEAAREIHLSLSAHQTLCLETTGRRGL